MQGPPLISAVIDGDGRGISLSNPGGILNAVINAGLYGNGTMRSRKVFCVTSYMKAGMQISYINIFTLYKWKTCARGKN